MKSRSLLEPGQRKSGYGNRVAWLSSLPPNSVGAEIGVLKGGFTQHIVSTVKPRCLYLIDCWCAIEDSFGYSVDIRMVRFCSRSLRDLAAESAAGHIRPLCGWSAEAAELIPDATLDWIYIDADHTMQGCLADLKAYYPKVKQGGIIGGHDYKYGWGCSVPEAVRRFMWSLGRDIDSVHTTDAQESPSFWFRK